ncbi:MAG: flagellar motor protein MotB [Planctomycetota bacterium]
MARKKKAAPEGAPMWMVTYGDMMTLLLCFFVMLAALANFDDQKKLFMAALESIRRAFGSPGQAGWLPDDTVDFKSLIVKLQTMYIPDQPQDLGHSDEPGVDGKFYRVKNVRNGLEMTIGGPIAFGRFSEKIEPTADALLQQLARELRGKNNKLEVRGHATHEPLPPGSEFKDPLDLGYARARTVRDRLVELGIDPRAIRVSSAGSYEPILRQTYDDGRRAANRRVEIVLTQALISDYEAAPQTPLEMTRNASPNESGPAP